MSKNIKQRGINNSTQGAYTDTVASYGSGVTPDADNILEDVTCDSLVAVGDVLRMSGATAVRALANSFAGSTIIGICVEKPTGTTANIQTCGYTADIFAGLSTSSTYFLSDSTLGGITSTPPTTSGSYVIRIGRSENTTNIIMQIERVVKRV